MFGGYPRRNLKISDYIWMILGSSLFVQLLAGFIGGILVSGRVIRGEISEVEFNALIGKVTILASIASLFLSAIIIHWRKIPIVNRKRLSSEQWVIIPGLSKADWRFLVKYIPLSYLAYLAGGVLLEFLIGPQAEATNQVAVEEMFTQISLPLMFVMVVIVAPIVEEWLFRGMILCRKGNRTGRMISIALSAFLFGAVHVPNNLTAWYAYGGMGLMFAYAVYRTESVEAGIVYHFLNNLLSFVMIWLTLSF